MATEDLCLVCADTLDWTGIGPCGHKEVCSRCVARVRFVMEDSKCMICKQDNPQVYFTRYMGDYTERPQDFAQQHLLSRAQQGELYELPEVNGFFDDQDHYKYIKALCSYTHPMVMGATFGTLSGLKRRLQEQQKLHFCDLCIKGRKVFISEQVLYSKPDLEKHLRTGDDTGPMAESGFKGHPLCRFCKQRFYDGDELYKHMEGRHEHCFICRKHHPTKFVYYKDYAELEDHFQSQHHPCPHPACLERKFVVFLEEAELKRHFAAEHGSDMNMSRAQRRQALAINIQLNYSREQEAAVAAAQRPGVVIGGGHNLPRRGGGGGGMRHSRSDGAMAAAVQASLESGQVESALRRSAAEAQPGSVTFSAEDFPSVSGQGGPGAAPLGTWLGASSSGQSASLTQDDFPALPSTSRNQRKKQRERERLTAATLAGRLAAANAPIRVVNRASAAGPSSGASGAAAAAADSAAAASSSSSGLVRHSSSTGNLASASSTCAGEEPAGADSDDEAAPAAAAAAADDFPALGGGGGAAATQAHPAWVPVRRARPPRPGQAGAGSRAAAAPPSISDFPSLAVAAPASGRAAAKAPGSAGAGGKARAGGSSSAGAAPAAVSVAAAVSAAGGVSEELKAANKALIERCKAILSEEGFRDFREQSGAFMQGAVAAGDYHEQVVHLGLLSLVPQLAALCPDPAKRAALVAAHKAHLGAAAADMDGPAGPAPASSSRGWVPPEAAMAALQEVEQRGSWACERCTLVNAPNSRACEVCSAPRPKAAPAAGGGGAATGAAAAGKPPSPAKQQPKQQWGAAAAGPGPAGSSAAAVVAAGLRQASPARASAGSASSSAASSPPPPVQRGADAWPSLAGPSGSSSSSSSAAAGSSSSQQQQHQQQPEVQQQEESRAGGAGGKGGKGGKSKGTKTSLQELLASGRSHPQNAWSQQQRKEHVATPAAPSGQWKAGGGAKLAKKIGAVNDAWSK